DREVRGLRRHVDRPGDGTADDHLAPPRHGVILTDPGAAVGRTCRGSDPCYRRRSDERAVGTERGREAELKPATFDYYAPASRDELLALLGELGDDARVLAGGQSLIPLMNFRLARPAQLVDVGTVDELAY